MNAYYDFCFHYFIHIYINIYISVDVCFNCIVHDFGALKVILKIQITSSLQIDWLVFIVGP